MVPALVSLYDDLAALEVGLIENMARENLNPVEEARACTTLVKEFGLTQEKVARRVGRSRAAVSNILRLLDLSEEILELFERGQLSRSHGEALLIAQDPQVRQQLACTAIEEGWSVRTLKAHAGQSNIAVPAQRQGRTAQGHDLGVTALNVARVWGDALGAEVLVRTLPHRKLRLEIVFDSPEGAFAFGGRIGKKIARGSKCR
jgi:ParB family chromosome partitioning protein